MNTNSGKTIAALLLSGPNSRMDRRPGLHGRLLLLAWLGATAVFAAAVIPGIRGPEWLSVLRPALHAAYVAALLWHLARTGPSLASLPESPLGRAADGRAGRWVAAGAAFAACLVGLLDLGLFLLSLAAATIAILVAWRRQLTLRAIVCGLTASALAFLAGGMAFWRHGFVPRPTLIFMLVVVPPMFVAGGLLVARTGLSAVRVLEGRYRTAWWSFLSGAALFVPLGLANAASPARPGLTWVTEWWQPLVLPVWSGIGEEVVFRTLLVCLLFALWRPLLKRSPAIALVLAVLFSAITFGLGHGRNLGNLLGAGLGYGLPMAVVFARRDWEHAVGAHYMINLAPWIAAWLAT